MSDGCGTKRYWMFLQGGDWGEDWVGTGPGVGPPTLSDSGGVWPINHPRAQSPFISVDCRWTYNRPRPELPSLCSPEYVPTYTLCSRRRLLRFVRVSNKPDNGNSFTAFSHSPHLLIVSGHLSHNWRLAGIASRSKHQRTSGHRIHRVTEARLSYQAKLW